VQVRLRLDVWTAYIIRAATGLGILKCNVKESFLLDVKMVYDPYRCCNRSELI
jgi:hypothetical protein